MVRPRLIAQLAIAMVAGGRDQDAEGFEVGHGVMVTWIWLAPVQRSFKVKLSGLQVEAHTLSVVIPPVGTSRNQ